MSLRNNKVIDDTPIEKRYFLIGDVAKELKCAPSKIRFWCTFLDIQVKTGKKKVRQFTRDDINILKKANWLQKEKFMTLEGVKHELKVNFFGRLKVFLFHMMPHQDLGDEAIKLRNEI